MGEPSAPPAFLLHDGPVVYAHRGGGLEHPENSVAAFGHAIACGLSYLETDARLSADGVLVALHDPYLDRVTEGRGLISDRTAAEITALRLRDASGELTDERVPVLEDLLRAWPQARFNIDAKDASTVAPLGDLLERLDLVERCCVGAFSDERLAAFRRRFGPALCTALGPKEVARLRAAGFGVKLGGPQGRIAQVPIVGRVPAGRWRPSVPVPIVDRWFLAACRRVGVPVHVWTVNDPAEMHALLDRGVEGFMTDRPSVAAEVLRARPAASPPS